MPSLIQGYEYDIFISYRHNDNRSGWVTEFVNVLQEELAATIKEPLSIYFDKNPHDGLLETHNVDKSLEGKLKCLIFLPIISQTYCDTKSFAWQHEFVAFNKLAKDDRFGRDIKLSNGNVTSRILPIKIHDLDAEDKSLLETEIGGVLRAIEFIYKEAGVNRPLKSTDSKTDNLNKTDYRNQVNKVANAIKEIITAIKNPSSTPSTTAGNGQPVTGNAQTPIRKKAIITSLAVLLIVIIGGFIYQQRTNTNEQPTQLDKSIAVLPFVNMSNDPEQEYFSDGVSEELINILSRITELKVIARTSSFSFKGKNEDVREIGRKLDVAHLLSGSVRKAGLYLRINANLINVSDGSNLWSKTYEYELKDVFKIQEDVANDVVKELRAKLVLKENVKAYDNNEVYDLLLHGKFLMEQHGQGNLRKAIEMYRKAIEIDSTDARAWAALSLGYNYQILIGDATIEENYERAKQAALRAIKLDDNYAEGHRALAMILHSHEWEDWVRIENEYQTVYSMNPGNAVIFKNLCQLYTTFGRFEKAIQMGAKAIELDPVAPGNYLSLGRTYLALSQYQNALGMINKSIAIDTALSTAHSEKSKTYLVMGKVSEAVEEAKLEPVEGWRLHSLAIAYFSLNQNIEADRLLKELIDKHTIGFAYQIACVYAMRNDKDKAFEWLEEAYRQRDNGLTRLLGEPFLKNLEKDPRYLELLRKMNFPK